MNLKRACLCGVLATFLILPGRAAVAENALRVGTATGGEGDLTDIPLNISADDDVQGFVMVFEWDGSRAEGVDIAPSTGAGRPLENAELIVERIEDDFMVFSVVMDTDGQGGEVIRAGQEQRVGLAKLRCRSAGEEVPIEFVDGEHAAVEGGPVLFNLLAIDGRSIREEDGLRLRNGRLSCQDGAPGDEEVVFACGGPLDDGVPEEEVDGPIGTQQEITFYYRAPASPGVQGLSMSVMYGCDLHGIEDSFDTDGGALEESEAEFVHLELDNAPSERDGDSCELTLGVLVDATSPFDGRTLPGTNGFTKLFSVEYEVEDDADCGKCIWIKFRDGLDGNGTPPVKNLVSIEFESEKPDELINCAICVKGQAKFRRGDCNMSGAVDIADAAAKVGFIFLQGDDKFDAPCEDACDSNDDGRLDAADVVFVLNYLFVPGKPRPPSPGATRAGGDPTRDDLTCDIEADDC
jgi:hypothetical protein